MIEKVENDRNRIPKRNYFESLKLLKDRDIKLVIVGQEPYSSGIEEFGKYQLYHDGLAFSSSNTVKTPNTLKVLKHWFRLSDHQRGLVVGQTPNDLSYLINRGIFTMNVLWSTSFMKPKAHNFEEYYNISRDILRKIIKKNPNVRIALLGRVAKSMEQYVQDVEYITDIHPAAVRYKTAKYNGGLTKILQGTTLRLTL